MGFVDDGTGLGFFGRTYRSLGSALAIGLVLLAIGVWVVALTGGDHGLAGPGGGFLAWHTTGAVVAVVVSILAFRGRTWLALLGLLINAAVLGLLLWTQWWA